MSIALLDVAAATRAGLPFPDLYFTPAYGAAVEHSDHARWELAVFDGGRVLMPYLRRQVPPDLADGAALFDAVSPYGYAGAWAETPLPRAEGVRFRNELLAAWRGQGCVAEFHRLSGYLRGADTLIGLPDVELLETSATVLIDLRLGHEALWNLAEGRSRTSVRKARKLGYEATFRPAEAADMATNAPFRVLYEETMRRVGAPAYYFFSDAYYTALREAADVHISEVAGPDGIAAAALFLPFGELAHYHLSGSRPQAARDGANNLMIDEALRGLPTLGSQRLHLGGGVRAGDSLFEFKRGFGGEVLPFRVARSVVDAERCADLVRRRAAQQGCPPDALTATGYFPPYRATPPPSA